MATNRTASPLGGMQWPLQPVGDTTEFWAAFANPTFAVNDVLYLAQIPNYCVLTDIFIDLPQLDTGTSLVLYVGDNVTTTNGGVGSGGYFKTTAAANSPGTAASGNANLITPTYSSTTNLGYQHATLPYVYSITNTNVPVAGQALGTTATSAPGGIWLTLTVHTAANTATTTGSIYGYVRYSSLGSTASQTNPAL